MTNEANSISWQEKYDPVWMKAVVDTLVREDDETVVRYSGPCPRCTHQITVEVPRPPQVTRTLPTAPDTARHPCNCSELHAGQPDGRSGCGVWGYVFST